MDCLPDDAPAPRLCHLIKWPDFDGYGFNLHAERSNPGQFIGKIDDSSPAQLAGLREGDRIVEVNGVNISNENHRQVVERIKGGLNETKLLVVDADADAWYRDNDLVVKSSQSNVIYRRTPVPRPGGHDEQRVHVSQQQQQQQQQQASSVISGNQGNGNRAPPTPPPMPAGGALASSSVSPSLDDTNEPTTGAADSIEIATSLASDASDSLRAASAAPMSPDSGKGDDEPAAPGVITIEAEINRQSPTKQVLAGSVEKQASSSPNRNQQQQQIQPDSLEQSDIDNAKDQARLVHNGSADSGKSSSPDATSTVDSLEDHENVANDDEDKAQQEQKQAKQTTQVLTSAANFKGNTDQRVADTDDKVNHVRSSGGRDETVKSVTSKQAISNNTNTDEQSSSTLPHDQKNVAENNINNNNNSTSYNYNNSTTKSTLKQQQQQGLNNDLRIKTTTAVEQRQVPTSKQADASTNSNINANSNIKSNNINNNSNNNKTSFSGLNLNMTASEMRELLARRKKFDPKKAQMNIRQKYEIIQQM